MNFHADLAYSNATENWFVSNYPKLFALSPERAYDLIYLPTGESIDIKCERRPSSHPRLFFEKVSNSNKQSKGGVWKAVEDRISYFIYIHPSDNTFYVFRCVDLLQRLQELEQNSKIKLLSVRNTGYYTLGYAIDKSLVIDIQCTLEGLNDNS